jgi:cellulose synthase/poly-beta-1,6-N-acetylglucosamine synthase-like glycosyltransferase/spore germination protein YaaH/peptidoglycan/xylan/chitin deacetylase (PgdA/CDA1 family)
MNWHSSVSPAPRSLLRLVAAAAAVFAIAVLARTDGVAASVAGCGVLAAWALVRGPSASRPRRVAAGLIAGTTAAAVVAALALPTFRAAAPPLVVLHDRAGRPTSGMATVSASPADPAQPVGGTFEALGFVASDNEDSWAGLDADAPRLSTLAATGIALGRHAGSIEVTPSADALVRAHLRGARGLAVVSNYDGAAFNGNRAAAMLLSRDARHRFVSAVTSEVARRGWDGVLLDFESLPPTVRRAYPELLHALDQALGNRVLAVAVPATGGSDLSPYDLQALGSIADRVVWMAYDQHDPTGAVGPVAGLPWVRNSLAAAERAIPHQKLLLGVPGYGYAWVSPGRGADLTVPQAQALAAQPGAVATWDDTQQEWYVHTADGRQVWYDDARSFETRARLAADEGLAGVALWRVGAEDPASLDRMPVPILKQTGLLVGRRVQQVQASGLAALTFDDGPDPVWTPKILAILRREHVPAVFFVIGKQAQAHPELLRAELRDGDVIGNHTYSHPNLNTTSRWRTRVEIFGGEATVEGITGLKPVMFRSPYGGGDMSAHGVGSDQIAAHMGLHSVSWNDDSADWLRPGPGAIVTKVMSAATSRAVILLHDGGGDRSQTVAALPTIIHELRSRGYLFTTADALDGAIRSPYAARTDLFSKARGVGVIAAFRIQLALRRVGLWFLLLVIGASLLRIALSAVLAIGHWSRQRRKSALPVALSVSVIVPAHNEERVIDKTLGALNRLRVAPQEVIVVDDGSTDATADVARCRGVTVVSQARQGKAAALNAGLRLAKGDIVVVLDADTMLSPDFLDVVLAHFADPRVAGVAGNVKVGNRKHLLGKLQAIEYIASLNLDRRAQAVLNVVAVVPGAAGAFRREVLLRCGGYPSDTLVEDMDLTVSLLRAGWRIPYEPKAVAFTEAPERTRDVLRQRRRWSFGTLQVVAKHSDALLDPRSGRVGLLGLPWLLTCQVVLPLTGPFIDLYLLYMLLTGQFVSAAVVALAAVLIDLAVVAFAVLMDGEPKRYVLLAPLMRVLWRPLQLVAVALSVHAWIHGATESWRRVRRYNSVPAHALPLTSGVGG